MLASAPVRLNPISAPSPAPHPSPSSHAKARVGSLPAPVLVLVPVLVSVVAIIGVALFPLTVVGTPALWARGHACGARRRPTCAVRPRLQRSQTAARRRG
ncbi:hypothetical protein C8R44DRAFT_864759 [Mycena epipterygia]|nr:hypothetical protein C8R44DRAFT_864759 [Mycena epipterygia]